MAPPSPRRVMNGGDGLPDLGREQRGGYPAAQKDYA